MTNQLKCDTFIIGREQQKGGLIMNFIPKIKYDKNIDSCIADISKTLSLSATMTKLLYTRGYITSEKIEEFLNPSLNKLNSPFLFVHMQKACERIRAAIARHELICVYGDYDVDGMTASSILVFELYRLGANVKCYIPSRLKEGYGLNTGAIEFLKTNGVSLIITVDCGITAVQEVDYANKTGIDVIITDHHEPSEQLPNSYAVIDAKVSSELYPFRDLCGAGVALKIVQALSGNEAIIRYLDLAALGTIADVVPLVNENRIITSYGLKLMNYQLRPALASLVDGCNLKGTKITSQDIAFKIAPILNACGRLSDANKAISFFSSPTIEAAKPLADEFIELNDKRKEIENKILEEATAQIQKDSTSSTSNILIVSGEDWNIGVVGIVASRITENWHKPSIVLSNNSITGLMTGSARSIPGVNIIDILNRCKSLLSKCGGHSAAAGLQLNAKNYAEFRDTCTSLCENIDQQLFVPSMSYDTEISIADVTPQLIKELERLEPCGMSNSRPIFYLKNVTLSKEIIIGRNNEHYRGIISASDNTYIDAIAWRQCPPITHEHLDILCHPTLNTYNGNITPQVQIVATNENADYAAGNNRITETAIYGHVVRDEPLEVLGIPDNKIKQLNASNIFTVRDLLHFVPSRYVDYRTPKTADTVSHKETCSMIGTVRKICIYPKVTKAICVDLNGEKFDAVWFYQDYVAKNLFEGTQYIFCGQINIVPEIPGQTAIVNTRQVQIMPTLFDRNIYKYMRLLPVYRKVKGMSNDYLMSSIKKAIDETANVDYLDRDIVNEFGLISEKDALLRMHLPHNEIDIEKAKKRQTFDQLFRFNFLIKEQNKNTICDTPYKMKSKMVYGLLKNLLPYELTEDQDTVISELTKKMSRGKRVSALVQGDVGTGKTVVAFFLMCLAHENGYQSCLLAPTDVLAKQHFEGLQSLVKTLGINVAYLSGNTKAREKKNILKGLENGEINMVIGTHAIIQDSVIFKNLAIAVIDEQHRFGVDQRNQFMKLNNKPHIITMTATPIPRTMCMAIWGDSMDVFNINTKPAGRKEIITKKIKTDKQANDFMLSEIKKGHQCYVICPLIDESSAEKMEGVTSVSQEAENIEAYFKNYPDINVVSINGKMKKDEIEQNIQKFANNEASILVSTTIVEVGVNVPNATVMVIKNSERFGLAQAHQLRGRVGRGNAQSYCLLLTHKNDPKAEILCKTNDGFEISKQDMILRGTGDYLGTQQTGNNSDVMLMIAEPELYDKINKLNEKIFKNPQLYKKYHFQFCREQKDSNNNTLAKNKSKAIAG